MRVACLQFCSNYPDPRRTRHIDSVYCGTKTNASDVMARNRQRTPSGAIIYFQVGIRRLLRTVQFNQPGNCLPQTLGTCCSSGPELIQKQHGFLS